MNPTSAAFFIIGLVIGILVGWFIILLISCIGVPVLSSQISRDERTRTDEPYTEAYDDEMEWVLGEDQQYKRVKKP